MPKGEYKTKNIRKSPIETIEILITSDNSISNEFSESYDEEREIKNKILNEYIYKTPIPFEKKSYFPSTPKKKENCNDEEISTQGRNLTQLFESL